MSARVRSLAVVALAVVAVGLGSAGWQAAAQIIPPILTTTTHAPSSTTTLPLPTTTTAAPPGGGGGTTTTAPPGGGGGGGGGGVTTTTAPPGGSDPGQGADGGSAVSVGGLVPPSAQAVINSIVRTPANNNAVLVQGALALEAIGVPHDQAVRETFGAFPVGGPAHWSDDWFFPRWTGATFRYHLGCDVFAEYGTPVRAPADGVTRISTNPLGGLTASVVLPDGTYFYMAHLSGIAPGVTSGMAVTTGQVVGFVGDSGNAKGGPPHLHFGYYPQGGDAAPPKPLLDRWVAEAAARLPGILAAHQAGQPRGLLATGLVRRLADEPGATAAPASPSRTELLWASSANPAGGGLQLAEARATEAAESIDWQQRAADEQAYQQALAAARQQAWVFLGPLTPPALRVVFAAG